MFPLYRFGTIDGTSNDLVDGGGLNRVCGTATYCLRNQSAITTWPVLVLLGFRDRFVDDGVYRVELCINALVLGSERSKTA